MNGFLPTTKEELKGSVPDFIVVTADAYVDHPSFGHAIISRLIESEGFSVAILPQPLSDAEYIALGNPKIAFMVSGGVVDSMVANYSVAKIKRDHDSYSEGGRCGRTPDRAVTFHTKNLKRLFPQLPVIIGGVEASLRRFAHYDYWQDTVLPSILIDSGADLLIYGMGERPLWDILSMLKKGVRLKDIKDIRGTAYLMQNGIEPSIQQKMDNGQVQFLPSYEEVSANQKSYVKAFNTQYNNSEHTANKPLLQKHGKRYVVVNPPQYPLTTEQLDYVYELPYMREYHPRYKDGVPALTEVKFSVTSHRGCFGACAYCSITMLQGRLISARSKESMLREAKLLTKMPDFKGYINDVSGPSANMRIPSCAKQAKQGSCIGKSCLGYTACDNLKACHSGYLDILREMRELPGIKKVFIRSGIRYDYLMLDPNYKKILKELVEHHISGQLKVAPEHCSESVLKIMGKPSFRLYRKFSEDYKKINSELGYKQFLVPYLISSHPGSTTRDAIELAVFLKSIHYMPLQVQDFYPTPSTKATTMYYTGINPDTMQEVYVPRDKEEKRAQRALMQYGFPQNYEIVKAALEKENMNYLIGNGPNCLIKSSPPAKYRVNPKKKR
ncbi:MAG: YgiQ family radical SAM protein [Clostridia bacterium]|nr:YgiQ family radical SAM protein [Clostridia bacterium]